MPQPLPHISRVHVERFRSIRALDLALPRFSVFVGPNGSGKTNLIQALALLGEILQSGSTEPIEALGWENVARRGRGTARAIVLGATLTLPEGFWPNRSERAGLDLPAVVEVDLRLVPGPQGMVRVARERLSMQGKLGRLHIERRGQAVDIEVEGEDRVVGWVLPWKQLARTSFRSSGGAPAHEKAARELTRFLPRNRLHDERHLNLVALSAWYGAVVDRVIGFFRLSRIRVDATALREDAPARGAMDGAGRGLPAAVEALRGRGKTPSGAFRVVLRALQEIYPTIEDVIPVRTQPGRVGLVFKEAGVKEPFGQTSVSDGVLHALALLVKTTGADATEPAWARSPGALAVEEPENAIHPWAIRVLMDAIQRRGDAGRQVLVTTHSVEVVNHVRDPASLYICEAGKRGTVIVPATTREKALTSIMHRTGERLGDIWHSGALGGVP